MPIKTGGPLQARRDFWAPSLLPQRLQCQRNPAGETAISLNLMLHNFCKLELFMRSTDWTLEWLNQIP